MDKNISLNVKCPMCGKSLMDASKPIDNKPSTKLLLKIGDKSGTIWLSSIYGSYNHISDIDLVMGDIATFTCPNCNLELDGKVACDECGAPMVKVCLPEGGRVSFCSRAGCQKHFIEIEDLETALAHFHKDFPYAGSSTT